MTMNDINTILKALPFINDDLIYFYNYHSNKIENNSLTLGETVTVLKDGFGVSKPLKDIRDVENHHRALHFVFELVKAQEPLSLRTIREIQALVEPERTGFRTQLVEILNTDVKTAEPFEISLRLEQILENYHRKDENKDEQDFFYKLAEFHIAFERIHPFIDGNGRTGRLLLNLELLKAGYPLTTIKFEDRPMYYDAFSDVEKMKILLEKSVQDTIEMIVEKAK